jgi:hypothetical protein
LIISVRFRKLRRYATNFLLLETVSPNCTSKEGHELTHIALFQRSVGHFTCRLTYVLLLTATVICLASLVVQHAVFLYSWQWCEAQLHTQNTLRLSHCNNGYLNSSQRYVMHILPTECRLICYDQSFGGCKAVLPVRVGICSDFNGVSGNLLVSMSVDWWNDLLLLSGNNQIFLLSLKRFFTTSSTEKANGTCYSGYLCMFP